MAVSMISTITTIFATSGSIVTTNVASVTWCLYHHNHSCLYLGIQGLECIGVLRTILHDLVRDPVHLSRHRIAARILGSGLRVSQGFGFPDCSLGSEVHASSFGV